MDVYRAVRSTPSLPFECLQGPWWCPRFTFLITALQEWPSLPPVGVGMDSLVCVWRLSQVEGLLYV